MSQIQPAHHQNRKPNPYGAVEALRRVRPLHLFRASIVALLYLALAANLGADTISGTVKDPSGAVVVGARIEITGGNLSQPLVLTSDESGKFSAPNLNPGKYSVHVTKDGFEDLVITVELKGAIDLPLNLTIAAQQTRVIVTEKSIAFANSDPVYRQLRDVGLAESFQCENFTLTMDVGTFEFKSGTFTLLTGQTIRNRCDLRRPGTFHAEAPRSDRHRARWFDATGGPTAEEDFTEVVFRFTGNQYSQFVASHGYARRTHSARSRDRFSALENKVRHRHELPEGFSQAILKAKRLTTWMPTSSPRIYNPKHPAFLNAYMHGTPHKDLRFFIRTRVARFRKWIRPRKSRSSIATPAEWTTASGTPNT